MNRGQCRDGDQVSSATGTGTPHLHAGPELIYCASGNSRFAQIAIDHGFTYGAQLPGTIYFQPQFVDQDWKKPNREKYMNLMFNVKPRLATVLDLEAEDQLPEVMEWAEEASQYVSEAVIIIPKVFFIIPKLPKTINGIEVRLGYSVPTMFGGTELAIWEFSGRPVHLLGGSPDQQMRLAHYMNVKSADGNMAQKMATQNCLFWQPGKRPFANKWVSLKESGGGVAWGDGSETTDAPYEAFRRSCVYIPQAWHRMFGRK
jgi:hypothetical protein